MLSSSIKLAPSHSYTIKYIKLTPSPSFIIPCIYSCFMKKDVQQIMKMVQQCLTLIDQLHKQLLQGGWSAEVDATEADDLDNLTSKVNKRSRGSGAIGNNMVHSQFKNMEVTNNNFVAIVKFFCAGLNLCLSVCCLSFVCMFVCVCLFVCLFLCLFVCLFVCLLSFVCLFVCVCLCVCMCLSICLFVCLFVYLAICVFICCLSFVCLLSVYLSAFV